LKCIRANYAIFKLLTCIFFGFIVGIKVKNSRKGEYMNPMRSKSGEFSGAVKDEL
jgi:hypothetical protein